jgi:O-antigen ligase
MPPAESVAARTEAPWVRVLVRVDRAVVGIWVLVGALVLYLSIDGGGYAEEVHSQVGVVVWWSVLVGAAFGLLPAARLTKVAWWALGLFGGFVIWTALATTWSISTERSLESLSLVAGYLGILVLAIAIHSDRERAIRHTIGALATAIVFVCALALASRLHPEWFPAAQTTGTYLPGAHGRLSWPLNYWNALGALVAFGLPLLLVLATSARTIAAQAASAAAIPLLGLCGYLTFSRGAAIASAVALIVFIALAPNRLPKILTALVGAAGGAILVAGAYQRDAIEHGLASAAAHHQGATLFIALLLVCAGVAVVQAGVAFAVRHATPARIFVVPRRRAQVVLAAGVLVAVIAAIAAGGVGEVSHLWREFKNPHSTSLASRSLSRFGSASGNGRYDYWKAAIDASSGHPLTGSGPGTFQLLWLPRAPTESYVVNAHSLYVETYAEEGLIGLVLLVGFFVLVLGSAIRLVIRSRYEQRTRAAGLTAALAAFMFSAAFDWIWQVPALPAAFLLLAAAVLAPRAIRGPTQSAGASPLPLRFGVIAVAAACLIGIAIPLATANALNASQAASGAGDNALALKDAERAASIEPGSATPQLQIALVLEAEGRTEVGLDAALKATKDEPQNWETWLILSRLEAETGRARASAVDYGRARSLNPHSSIFQT